MMYKISDLLDLEHTIAAELFEGKDLPLGGPARDKGLHPQARRDPARERVRPPGGGRLDSQGRQGFPQRLYRRRPASSTTSAEVRHCAFIRGSAIVGKGCVVGNSVELKNVVLFDNVQAPHYNYVGDSILGYKSAHGRGLASRPTSRATRPSSSSRTAPSASRPACKKFGAILGDYVEVGCNSVLNPGSVIGRRASIYPTSSVRGVVPGGQHLQVRRGDSKAGLSPQSGKKAGFTPAFLRLSGVCITKTVAPGCIIVV